MPSQERLGVRLFPPRPNSVFDILGPLCLTRNSTAAHFRRSVSELRRFGTSGLRVSALSLGAMTFGASQTLMKGVTSSDEEARRVFDRALEAGINLVDTANVYTEGRSEELTGEWVAGKRDQMLIATKCRFPMGHGRSGAERACSAKSSAVLARAAAHHRA